MASLSNGFIARCIHQGAEAGPLKGLTFAVKDMYQVKGHTNACGNPTWLATHPDPAAAHAPCVQALLDAGATMVGVAHMDELAYSLNGQNHHYGTPVNKAERESVPGGSSSGSASIVAWEEADLAIGSDTAGSVRIPASYQGIFGFRPTHGRVSMAQSVPLAPSFDTCGWFARSAKKLRKAAAPLLATGEAPEGHTTAPLKRWLVAEDAFLMNDDVGAALYRSLSSNMDDVRKVLGEPTEIHITGGEWSLLEWLEVFRTIQSSEVWATHGDWIMQHNPTFGPGIRERFDAASKVTADDVEAAKAARAKIVEHVSEAIVSGSFLTIPTAPGPAPALKLAGGHLEAFRTRALSLTSIAGLCGLPQVTVPTAAMPGGPVGLGIIGPKGSDEALLDLAVDLSDALGLWLRDAA